MSKKYQHLFFDLDRTLWDFEKSAHQAFKEIFEIYKLDKLGIENWEEFHKRYEVHNLQLWDLYRVGKIEKSILMWKRFSDTLEEYGIDNPELAQQLGNDYLSISPRKVNLYPHTIETLKYLYPKYELHIITNGFQEVQNIKLEISGMDQYFKTLITSEKAGVKKPDPVIFEYALKKTGATVGNSLMIGDDYEVDIIGAGSIGMDQVFFDPEQQFPRNGSTFKISSLAELKEFL
ncbi:MAG: noncanonical pyrimidine nucleotidase, YjjG family [Bacteroidales bacterium]|nr:noncanonical pyrimidine nucleotidase, YjjG family [Bacteroidales bacterium]